MTRIRFLPILFFVILFLTQQKPSAANFQTDDLYWYFAWNPAEAHFVAFTLDGQMSIPQGETRTYPSELWRLDGERILISYPDNSLYLLTPTTFQRVDQLRFPEEFAQYPFMPLRYHYPYLVLVPNLEIPPFFPHGYVANLETGKIDMLTFNLHHSRVSDYLIRFSEDGTSLRYWAGIDNDSEWVLIDLHLQSGFGKPMFTADSPGLPTTFGDYWIAGVETNGRTQYQVVNINGNGVELPVTLDRNHRIRISGEDFIWSPEWGCTADCGRIEILSLAGSSNFTFILPPDGIEAVGVDFARLDENRVLLYLWDERSSSDIAVYLLRSDGGTEKIGSVPQSFRYWRLSANRGWLFLSNEDGSEIRIWDSIEEKVILQQPLASTNRIVANSLTPQFSEHVIAWREYSAAPEWYFREGQPAIIPLASIEGGSILELAVDGRLLVHMRPPIQGKPEYERPPGIYAYDPVADTYQSLIEGVFLPLYFLEWNGLPEYAP